ncbi:hypothetical protein DFP93_104295 [Aneurinibacillus soli]|uniref:Uncharacterized protein n=1 Tax=Aneurinibacillus soli TaxID=1500254 RepID=A0A0U4NE67_9BACL|nr:hypothetical protein [Aneurinibacillus soli]PYE62642.1 hypothetical protein DFP93_104295 [Aneurinibacillus soli]BAU27204.1 hypothetical protein CB4_01373 [Aneurinibacillus soli]
MSLVNLACDAYRVYRIGKPIVTSKVAKRSYSKARKNYEKKLKKTKKGREQLKKLKAQEKAFKKTVDAFMQPLGKAVTLSRRVANNLPFVQTIRNLKASMKAEVIKSSKTRTGLVQKGDKEYLSISDYNRIVKISKEYQLAKSQGASPEKLWSIKSKAEVIRSAYQVESVIKPNGSAITVPRSDRGMNEGIKSPESLEDPVEYIGIGAAKIGVNVLKWVGKKAAGKIGKKIVEGEAKEKASEYASSAAQYQRLKGSLAKEEIQSVIKTTEHGAERLMSRGFSPSDISALKLSPSKVLTQSDGASVYIKDIGAGKFNVIVESENGVVTALKNISENSLNKLSRNYGWK